MSDYFPVMASGGWNDSGEASTNEEVEKSFKKSGFEGLKQTLQTLKAKPLDIGVVGSTGAGKSSLVNSLIDMEEDDGGAPVGEIETTNQRKRYKSRRNPDLYVWDVPGMGTEQHPRTTYIEEQKIMTFDLVIIVSRARFTEDDAWLVNELRQNNRRYLFVRTLIDNDIMTSSRRMKIKPAGEFQHEKTTMDKVRQDCLQKLRSCQEHIQGDRLFLVCAFKPAEYDFPRLLASLTDDSYVSSSKKHAMKEQIRSLYNQDLLEKRNKLKGNIPVDAAPSAIMSAIPVPGVGFIGDLVNINKVFDKYRTTFGIDDDGLKKYADLSGTEMSRMKTELGLKVWDVEFTVAGIVSLMPYRGVALACKFVPVVGSLVGAGVTYSGTFQVLQLLLDIVFKDAMKVNDYVAEKIQRIHIGDIDAQLMDQPWND